MKKFIITVSLITLGTSFGLSQNIGINTTGNVPDPSAGLDVDFTDKGVLIPRVALVQTTNTAPIAAPANSLLVFNTATVNDVVPGYYYWYAGRWIHIGAGSGDEWLLEGNAGTDPTINFLGTTDNQHLLFKTNNLERMRILSTGSVIFNENALDIDFRMETVNRQHALYLDASKDVLFVGDDFGDYQNGSTIDAQTVDYVANFDNGSVSGTAVGIGSIEYLLDRSGETTINNRFSPSTDGGEDLGGTARRWDEIFAQNGVINTSDRRDKKNITPLNYGLKEIMLLNPVTFEWNDDLTKADQKGMRKIGLIAQELQPIFPEVVKTKDLVKVSEDPVVKEVQEAKRWGVFYSDLIPVLIKALQEEDAKVENLKKQLEEQSAELDALEEQKLEVQKLKEQNAQQQALIDELVKRMEKLESSQE